MQRFDPELCVFFAQECAGQIKLHHRWNLLIGLRRKLCNHRHVRWSIYHAGFSGHQNENMVAKPCDSMHRNLSRPYRSHYRWNGRIREAYNHSIDDPLLRAALRPHPSPQVQQHQHQDGALQELHLHNCGLMGPRLGRDWDQRLLVEHELRDLDHP